MSIPTRVSAKKSLTQSMIDSRPKAISVHSTIESSNAFVKLAKSDLNRIACASCVLYGDHQKHDILSLDESFELLQKEIGKSLTSGGLNSKKISSHIFEIKHAAYLCVEEKEKLKASIHKTFERIKNACCEREKELLAEVESGTKQNLNCLSEFELKWSEKLRVCQELLCLIGLLERGKLSNLDCMIGAQEVYRMLKDLEEPFECSEIEVPAEINFTIQINDSGKTINVSHENLIDDLRRFGTFKDKKAICFKK